MNFSATATDIALVVSFLRTISLCSSPPPPGRYVQGADFVSKSVPLHLADSQQNWGAELQEDLASCSPLTLALVDFNGAMDVAIN